MGVPIFSNLGIDIAALVNQHIGPGMLPATLTKRTPGTRTPSQLTGGTNPTTTSYACRGMLDSQDRKNQDGTLSEDGTLKAFVIGDSIASDAVPEVGDELTIEGTTYVIEKVDRDPAAASYELRVVAK